MTNIEIQRCLEAYLEDGDGIGNVDVALIQMALDCDDEEVVFLALLVISTVPSISKHFSKSILSLCDHNNPYIKSMAIRLLRHFQDVDVANKVLLDKLRFERHDDVLESVLFCLFSINTKEIVQNIVHECGVYDSLSNPIKDLFIYYMSS